MLFIAVFFMMFLSGAFFGLAMKSKSLLPPVCDFCPQQTGPQICDDCLSDVLKKAKADLKNKIKVKRKITASVGSQSLTVDGDWSREGVFKLTKEEIDEVKYKGNNCWGSCDNCGEVSVVRVTDVTSSSSIVKNLCNTCFNDSQNRTTFVI